MSIGQQQPAVPGVLYRSAAGFTKAEAAAQIRYKFGTTFGTTEGEISGKRIGKRRSAKHLEFVPSLLEAMQYKTLSAAAGVAHEQARHLSRS
jgi:hypothetical protein